MTKAVRRLTEVLFNDLGLARIEIRCGENNIRSKLVAERAGFMLEGISEKKEFIHGRFANLVVYSRFADADAVAEAAKNV
jgi:ribosomal-protein-serine acetyltransferase